MKLYDVKPNTVVRMINGREFLFHYMGRSMAVITDHNGSRETMAGWTEVEIVGPGPEPEPPPTDNVVV